MPDKPPLITAGTVRVSPALLRQAARILHREARQLREAYTIPGTAEFEDRQAALDHQRYTTIAAQLVHAAAGPLITDQP